MRGAHRWLLAGSALALASAAQAGETITYTYDALGRLTATTSTKGTTTGIGYDPAGNRSTYSVTGAPPPPPPPPAPPPSPPGSTLTFSAGGHASDPFGARSSEWL